MNQKVEVRRKVVNIMQACTIACVSRRTIYNWMAAGKIEFVRSAGGNVRIYLDTLLKPHDPTDPLYRARVAQATTMAQA